jgi:DUF1365 family protein
MVGNVNAFFKLTADKPINADFNQAANKDLPVKNSHQKLKSAIYSGWVEHIRYAPTQHQFQYQVFMMYLDLDEIDQVFSLSRLWSQRFAFAPAYFKRADYLGDANKPLKEEVLKRIKDVYGVDFKGSVRLLTNIRYFGYVINPISCYYCFDEDEKLKFLVAEVTNTPWEEKVSYVLRAEEKSNTIKTEFKKALHVSPFNPMDMTYRWHSNQPDNYLFINLGTVQEQFAVLDANVFLKREEISAQLLRKKVIHYPLMTVKVVAAIYWQALQLVLKKTPIYKKTKL